MPDTASTAGPDVLAATDREVILRGRQYSNATDERIECVLYVPRALYHVAIDAWLDAKAKYFAHRDEFCGVGAVEWSSLTRRQGRMWLATEDGPQNVLAYDAAGFVVDMEHG